MKHYTSIEQSNKLLELGLDPETADLYYPNSRYEVPTLIEDDYRFTDPKYRVPCWSTDALFELMPNIKAAAPILIKSLLKAEYFCTYNGIGNYNLVYITDHHECPVDACYDMVAWLLENGYIKSNKK